MFKKPSIVVAGVTGILLLYCLLIGFNAPLSFIYFIFIALPFLLLWMGFTIIRHGTYKGKELDADEEWGYQDRKKDEIDVL